MAVNTVLLAQAPATPQRPAIGIALGVAGVAAALAGRTSRQAGAVFLLSLGALGFLPNPLLWLPAGVLMIAAGGCGLLDLRHPSQQAVAGTESAPTTRATPTTVSESPEGAPTHWSVVPRAKKAASPNEPVAAAAPSPAAPQGHDGWSPKGKSLAAGLIIAAAAVVVPFTWWPQDSVASAIESSATAAAAVSASAPTAVSARSTTVSSEPPTESSAAVSADSGRAAEEGSPTTTTTLPATFARIGPVDADDPDAFVLFSDVRFGLTVALPATWAEVPASILADYDPATYHLATFADVDGPSHQNAFLNGITIEVLAGSQTEDPPWELVQQSLQRLLDLGPTSHEYYAVLEPIHEVEIGEVTGLAATVRLTWNERVMVKALYLCIANHCLYQIGLQTDDVDWATYEPLFDRVLDSFAFEPASL
jgi:hypothetical protein